MILRLFVAVVFACLATGASLHAQLAPYRDSTRTVDERVRDLLGRMTREEKFWQLYMSPGGLDDSTHDYSHGAFGLQIRIPDSTRDAARAHARRIDAIQRFFVERTRLGVPVIPFEEAVHGFMGPGATAFPQAIALAATWDTALVGRVATATARETRSRGVRQVLSPVINLATDVRWGRVEETYGVDPLLSARMAAAFVAPFEHMGVVATPKHFVANVGAGGRDSYPIDLSVRALEETHFVPFRAALRAGARSVMTAYNSVNGVPATQNRWLLTDVLKRAWGFGGFVISDAAATGGPTVLQHTEASTATATQHALDAGLDVIFQTSWEQHRPYLDAFTRGLIADSVIDAAVARVLRVKFALGLFEHPYVDPDSAAYWNGRAEHRALALEAARASIVLLKNERGVLPLAPNVGSLAVIGVDATEARLGGYSGPGNHPVSILAGLRDRLGPRAAVRYAPGPGRVQPAYVPVPVAMRGEYFDNVGLEGTPRVVRTDPRVDFAWTLNAPARGLPFDSYSVRWTGRLTVPASGAPPRRIGVEGNDGYRLWVDGRLVIDDWRKQTVGARYADVRWTPGSAHDVKLEFYESVGNARVRLVWDAGVRDDWRARIDSAESLARRSDVAVVVAGIEEGEFRDRSLLGLPGHQEELIARVAAAGKPTVVVLVGGSAITMPWLDRVAAVVDAWYPGEEGGHAVADVLLGTVNPAGRLPVTFPMREGQLPLVYDHEPTGRGDDYLDGTGRPLFPFGFGLSYTTFAYSSLAIEPAAIGAEGSATVRCRVRNTGTRAGDEVVQLYLRDVLASVARPVMRLAGFQRVRLTPGEEREVAFTVGREQLQMFDASMRWVVEPGTFRVMIGASSQDIRLHGDLTVR